MLPIYWNPDQNYPLPAHLHHWAERLGLKEINQAHPPEGVIYYCWEKDHLTVQVAKNLQVSIDWAAQWRYHQRQHYALSREPLAKAMGIKQNLWPKILDLTCGMGKDSLLFLFWGCEVVAYERSPAILLLLTDALHRSMRQEELGPIMHHHFTLNPHDPRDSHAFSPAEVIYLDPMYGDDFQKRKAHPKKEMQILQALVGYDPDAVDLFHWAMEQGPRRVVVKRPLRALPLVPRPDAQILGSTTRYDLYFPGHKGP
jgi:16S rRNA (guanine1516-N2)-methyltransferase